MTFVTAAAGLALLACLWKLGRLRELHHGYYALLLYGVAVWFQLPLWLALILYMVLADDLNQHAIQVFCLLRGEPVPPDMSPLHRLGEWLIVTLHLPVK
jgi:hypothetical protein